MSHQERRRSPRKECLVPLRFRVVEGSNGNGDTDVRSTTDMTGPSTYAHFGMSDGQAQNLSERGVYFVSRQRLVVGEEVELFLTIPPELTGRAAESVRCKGCVVYAQPLKQQPELTGVGVSIRYFEPIGRQSWAN